MKTIGKSLFLPPFFSLQTMRRVDVSRSKVKPPTPLKRAACGSVWVMEGRGRRRGAYASRCGSRHYRVRRSSKIPRRFCSVCRQDPAVSNIEVIPDPHKRRLGPLVAGRRRRQKRKQGFFAYSGSSNGVLEEIIGKLRHRSGAAIAAPVKKAKRPRRGGTYQAK